MRWAVWLHRSQYEMTPKANDAAMTKVRKDKLREVLAGHDGTWVAHPALVKLASDEFSKHMLGPNQMHIRRENVTVTADDLLDTKIPSGVITETGIRQNLSVGIVYIESWLRGLGCVPIHNLMEDAATAEISRSQLWQWVHHRVSTDKGQQVTADWVGRLLDEECNAIRKEIGEEKWSKSKFDLAKRLFKTQVAGNNDYADFLTTLCYDHIIEDAARSRPSSKL